MGETDERLRPRARCQSRSSQVLEPGDVVYVEPLAGKDDQFRLHQVPEVSGAS